MSQRKLNQLAENLKILATGLDEDAKAARKLVEDFPNECREIANLFSSAAKATRLNRSPNSLNRKTLESIATWSPDRFFAWFDENQPKLPRNELVAAMRRWLKEQEGKTYHSLAANQAVATGVNIRLDGIGFVAKCPGGPKSGPCGRPARLICKSKKVGYPHGAFAFTHAIATKDETKSTSSASEKTTGERAKKTRFWTQHGLTGKFPKVELFPKPRDRRIKKI